MAKRKITLKLGSRKKQRAEPDQEQDDREPQVQQDQEQQEQQVQPQEQEHEHEHEKAQEQRLDKEGSDVDMSQAQFSTLTKLYTDIVNNAMELKDESTGEVISGPFLKLPPKKLYPDYYELIEKPVSINEIRSAAVAKRRYGPAIDGNGVSLDDFLEMWQRLAKNAATYNDPESLIVNDANLLYDYATKRIEDYKNYQAYLVSSRDDAGAASTGAETRTEKNAEAVSSRRRNPRSKATTVEPEQESKEEQEGEEEHEGTNEGEATTAADDNAVKDENADQNDGTQKWQNRNPTKSEIAAYDDSNEDYTQELIKVYRHLLSFKISHHKNSIPLAKILLDLPNRDDPATEDYYDIITEPMCFNMIGERLEQGKYSQGTNGYKQFVDDVNLIFDNCLDVWGEGPYHKAATGLRRALEKRMEKFVSQVVHKRKIAAMTNRRETKKPSRNRNRDRNRNRNRNRSTASASVADREEDADEGEDDEGEYAEEGEDYDEQEQDQDQYLYQEQDQEQEVGPPLEVPTVIRKHDVEKAATVEEIDDITAFIKKFTICTTTNLSTYANSLRNLDTSKPASGGSGNANSFIKSLSLFENVIYEPAGNSTIGGSSYIMQLPGSAVIGHEISCNVYLQNKIVDEKYNSELLVNGETLKGIPMSITYDETTGDDGMFCAGKYALRLGYGLNYFEFTLKVPFPLKGRTSDLSEENLENMELEEKRERGERGPSQEFAETIKIWLNVSR